MTKKTDTTQLLGVKLSEAPRRFIPFGDRVLLERAKAEEVTAGGILLPVTAEGSEKVNVSIVRAVGADTSVVQPGDWVMHLPYAVEEVTINGQQFAVCRTEDLLGKLEE